MKLFVFINSFHFEAFVNIPFVSNNLNWIDIIQRKNLWPQRHLLKTERILRQIKCNIGKGQLSCNMRDSNK